MEETCLTDPIGGNCKAICNFLFCILQGNEAVDTISYIQLVSDLHCFSDIDYAVFDAFGIWDSELLEGGVKPHQLEIYPPILQHLHNA